MVRLCRWTEFAARHQPGPGWERFDPAAPRYLEIRSEGESMEYPADHQVRPTNQQLSCDGCAGQDGGVAGYLGRGAAQHATFSQQHLASHATLTAQHGCRTTLTPVSQHFQ